MNDPTRPGFDWAAPIPESQRLHIAKPATVHEFRPIPVADHRCTLEYRRVDGRDIRREIVIVHVRQARQSVLVAAHSIGAAADDTAEYRVHRMIALTGADGVRMPPIDYLREHLGIWIE